jgi:hypothetical protein
MVGIESESKTLKGVEALCKINVMPTLSPFRPDAYTALRDHPAPNYDYLQSIYLNSLKIAKHYNIKLGPICSACQNNTLTFP